MNNYKSQLENQLGIIENLIKKNEKSITKYKDLKDEKIRVSYSNGCCQYYAINDDGKDKYIPKTDIQRITRIVQKDYELAINKKLKEMEGRIKRFCKSYDFDEIKEVYDKLPLARKKLVTPIIETDDQYVERWLDEHPGNQNSFPQKGNIITSRGEHVRSKSEKIIADLFDKYGVPYRYEPSLLIGDNHLINPDFVVLNVRSRKTIYWEHLGLIDMEDYAIKNLKKICEYNYAGYELGENLIITMESASNDFDSRDIEAKIQKYCL